METHGDHSVREAGHHGHAHALGEINELFERLAKALTNGDVEAVVAMWDTPSFVIGDDTARTLDSDTELEDLFGGAKEKYNEGGVFETKPQIRRCRWLSDRLMIVEVRWPHLDATGREVDAESSTYVLRRDPWGDLKLHVAMMHGMEHGSKH